MRWGIAPSGVGWGHGSSGCSRYQLCAIRIVDLRVNKYVLRAPLNKRRGKFALRQCSRLCIAQIDFAGLYNQRGIFALAYKQDSAFHVKLWRNCKHLCFLLLSLDYFSFSHRVVVVDGSVHGRKRCRYLSCTKENNKGEHGLGQSTCCISDR